MIPHDPQAAHDERRGREPLPPRGEAVHVAAIAALERELAAPDWCLGRNPEIARAHTRKALAAHRDMLAELRAHACTDVEEAA